MLSLWGELNRPDARILPEESLPASSSDRLSTLNKLSSLFPTGFRLFRDSLFNGSSGGLNEHGGAPFLLLSVPSGLVRCLPAELYC